MIRTLYYNAKGSLTTDVPQAHWRTVLRDEGGVLWVDFGAENAEKVEPVLRETFGLHSLAIDDALRETHVPKIDNWQNSVYVCVHAVVFDEKTLALTTNEVDIFLGRNFLVTLHWEPVPAIDRMWRHVGDDHGGQRLGHGSDHLLYDLLDLIVADYMPVIDKLDDALDRLEDDVFDRPTPLTLNQIFSAKRALLRLRRIVTPQREVLNRLARDDYPFIDPKDRVYFRDVYDHLVRLADLVESLRDLVGGAMDTYLSVVSNRTNDIMKALTVVSVLMLPISFLAGFFGMNFTGIPFGDNTLLWIAVVSMILVPAAMLAWFKRRGWW
jgi:magnesium transporter